VNYVNRARAFMPTGTVPPFVMRFDAGSVPVGDLVFSDESGKLGVKALQDAALFRVRPLFATLRGVSAPPPFGGSPRSIVISADPDRLRAYNMSPDEVVQAITKGNTISPSGNVRFGNELPMVPVNSVVTDVQRLGDVPIRSDGTRTIFVRDIGTVADSADIEVGYALVNGHRTVYIPVTKRADASTLSVVNLVKENIPKFQAVLPPGVKVSYEFDQSPFVTRAILGLTEEGLLGAVLTGLVVLLFLGDWRSALVVVVNIPLSILAAMIALWASGQTVNLMTLGGRLWRSASWSTRRPSPSRTSIRILGAARPSRLLRMTARPRQLSPVSSRCFASSQSSSPLSSCRVRRIISSFRWRWRWASRWSPLMCCPPRSSRSC
jgi:multidrug efflux pump subunit AcrB